MGKGDWHGEWGMGNGIAAAVDTMWMPRAVSSSSYSMLSVLVACCLLPVICIIKTCQIDAWLKCQLAQKIWKTEVASLREYCCFWGTLLGLELSWVKEARVVTVKACLRGVFIPKTRIYLSLNLFFMLCLHCHCRQLELALIQSKAKQSRVKHLTAICLKRPLDKR